MTINEVKGIGPLALFRTVFGKKEAQTLSEFVAEMKPLTQDEKFVAEVREYALKNLVTE